MSDEMMRLSEATEFLGVSRRTLERRMAAGELTAYRSGASRLLKVKRDDVLALAEMRPVIADGESRAHDGSEDNA